jgi:hypothetical protein
MRKPLARVTVTATLATVMFVPAEGLAQAALAES